jgi:hypothetical protein
MWHLIYPNWNLCNFQADPGTPKNATFTKRGRSRIFGAQLNSQKQNLTENQPNTSAAQVHDHFRETTYLAAFNKSTSSQNIFKGFLC